MNKMKVVVVTGASSGIGLAVAKYYAHNGFKVYGVSRTSFEEERIISLQADVTDYESLLKVYKEIYETEERFDILINNAGMGISGSIEETKIEDAQRLFDVNFMGVFLSTKAGLPYLRKNKAGKIINIGSVAGSMSIPFQAFYSSSKAAVKAFSDALANEIAPFKIQVCTVLPGDIKTNFTKNRRKNESLDPEYQARIEKSLAVMEKDEQNGMTVEYAAKIIYRLGVKEKMPLVKTIGVKYKVFVFLKRLLPERFVNWAIGLIYAFKKEKNK
ncbi:MAG: SDR family oxidoreductase [Acholeplasmataceae bacterium]